MGHIYKRSKLCPAEIRDLERQQFNELDSEDQILYEAMDKLVGGDSWIQNELPPVGFKTNGAETTVVETEHVELSLADMRSLVARITRLSTGSQVTRGELSEEVVDQYMNLICQYVNDVRRKKPEEQEEAEEEEEEVVPPEVADRPWTGYRSHTPEPHLTETPEPYYPSCVYISASVLQELADEEESNNEITEPSSMSPTPTSTLIAEATRILEDRGCTGDNFLNLDYLFIVYTDGNHYTLMGLAPKQKYAFNINSMETDGNESRTFANRFLLAALLSQVPAPDTWPIYGEWANRDNDVYDGSPNCCRQGDSYNCGTMTVTNAFCLAFGFDLMCYRQRDIDSLKRPRMFAELTHGYFSGKYAYDMLDIPDRPQFTERRVRPVRQTLAERAASFNANRGAAASRLDPVVTEDDRDSDTEYVPGPGVIEAVRDENGDDPMHEARALLAATRPSNVFVPDFLSAMQGGLSSPMPQRAIQIGKESDTKLMRQRRETRMERRAFPPQFHSMYFRKEGFLYGGSIFKHPVFKGRTQSELADLLMDSPMASNEEVVKWSRESDAIFRKWAENRILACIALFGGDSVRPFRGISDEFEKWLEM